MMVAVHELVKAYPLFMHISTCRDSSVGIATVYGLDDQGEREFESR
jgi:hypothetical protein